MPELRVGQKINTTYKHSTNHSNGKVKEEIGTLTRLTENEFFFWPDFDPDLHKDSDPGHQHCFKKKEIAKKNGKEWTLETLRMYGGIRIKRRFLF